MNKLLSVILAVSISSGQSTGVTQLGVPSQNSIDNSPLTVTSIYDIQIASTAGSGDDCYSSSYDGQTVTVSATVTGAENGKYYIKDKDGAWNGVYVYSSSQSPAVGDSVEITAEVDEYYGLTELKNVSAYSTISSGGTVTPTDISTGDLTGGCSATGEQWEGVLVKLTNVTVTAVPDNNNQWYVNDGSGACQIDDGMFQYTPTSGQTFDLIVGIVDYGYSEYGVNPRSGDDIVQNVNAPVVAEPTITPAEPTSDDAVSISVKVSYGSAISSVVLDYTVSDGTSGQLSMTASGDTYSASISAQAAWTSVKFTITATAGNGTSTKSQEYTYSVSGASVPDVFISEYAEGSSNNKYLEIYNGTSAAIDMSLFSLSTCSNGCDATGEFDYPNNVEFASGTQLASGDVYIIHHGSADQTIKDQGDQTFTYLSNGDDIMALTLAGATASSYTIVDIIGEMGDDPGSGWAVAGVDNATKDHTLVRKASVTSGNTNWTASAGTSADDSEWIVYDKDTWDYIGSHSQNVNAFSVSVTTVSPDFIADNTEIEIKAELVPNTGSIASATIHYGTGTTMLNTTAMYLESGDTWIGTIPAQDGNSVLQFKVAAKDDSGNESSSTAQSVLVASSTPNDISDIHSNLEEGKIVTIQGIVTIGSGLLTTSTTKAYIQDGSGRGLNLFDSALIDLKRGDELRVVGYVEKYYSTVEVIDFAFETLSTGKTLPTPIQVTTSDANSSDWEGTLISLRGYISAIDSISTSGAKLTIDDNSGPTYVMIWNSTGLNGFDYSVGKYMKFTGVGSQYGENYQLLVAYEDDLVLSIHDTGTIPNQFILHPAYPNPFNPTTTISYSMDIAGMVDLEVHDVSGRIVFSIKQNFVPAGTHQTVWNASSLASGIYFIRLRHNANYAIQKVMMLK